MIAAKDPQDRRVFDEVKTAIKAGRLRVLGGAGPGHPVVHPGLPAREAGQP